MQPGSAGESRLSGDERPVHGRAAATPWPASRAADDAADDDADPPAALCYCPVPNPGLLTGDSTVTDRRAAAPGDLRLRRAPDGLPDPRLAPPVVAEAGDPFTAVRVIDLVARLERGQPVRLDDLVAALNARHLDWLFDRAAVLDVLIALQANWMADYRNASGIFLEDGPYGPTLTLEDSPRVDPWIVRQALRETAACRERFAEFARRDGTNHVG